MRAEKFQTTAEPAASGRGESLGAWLGWTAQEVGLWFASYIDLCGILALLAKYLSYWLICTQCKRRTMGAPGILASRDSVKIMAI